MKTRYAGCLNTQSAVTTSLKHIPGELRRYNPLTHTSYNRSADLSTSGNPLESGAGVQQGDPLVPLLFALGVEDISKSITSFLNVWYLDDATIGGQPDSVLQDRIRIIPASARVGLNLNPTKCEQMNVSCTDEDFRTTHMALTKPSGEHQDREQAGLGNYRFANSSNFDTTRPCTEA